MPASLLLHWRHGVSASETSDGALLVEGAHAKLALRPTAAALRDALLRFAPPGEDEQRLEQLVADGNGGLARWYYYVARLNRHGFVCYAVHADGACLATLVPISPYFVLHAARVVAGRRYVLSRFAYVRRDGGDAVLESPLAHARIVLNDARTAGLVGCLAAPTTVAEAAERVVGLSADAIAGALALFSRAGMLQEVGEAGGTSEDEDPALQTWAFHDLLFHARSRKGRCDAGYGATYRLAGRLEPPPALKPPPAGKVHELYRPDLDRLERDDPPLTQVLERRRSIRSFDTARPITRRQLGEFLFRVARVRDCREVDVATPGGSLRMEMAFRPYPAGGGLYELEVYIAVSKCTDLPSALYYYDAARHQLVRLQGRGADVTALLGDAGASAGIPPAELQALIILAARLPRLAWKYESIAYALTLKHVGVLYQTMYLAATAMGLAPCAIGGGDADLFTRAARAAVTDYASETSVGEFLLGSKLPDPPGFVG